MKPQIVFVLRGPGAGKGTQCVKIEEKYGYTHLSAGELLRQERDRPGSEVKELIDRNNMEGKLTPAEITIRLLQRAMDETMQRDKEKFGFLIDGFPRDQDNLEKWCKAMGGKADLKFVLLLECSLQICMARCEDRGRSGGRNDDNRKTLEKRIQTYMQSTLPVIEQFKEQGKLRTVDGSRSVNEVFAEIENIFDREG